MRSRASAASSENYHPEWVTSTYFLAEDAYEGAWPRDQYRNVFGPSFLPKHHPLSADPAAWAIQDGGGPPPSNDLNTAFDDEALYRNLLLIASGLQMAGPHLTPQTFAQGMFAYPPRTGPRGLWHFAPDDYTTTDDFREIWWDPHRISGQNNKAGAWVQLNSGARYTSANAPKGPAPFFKEG